MVTISFGIIGVLVMQVAVSTSLCLEQERWSRDLLSRYGLEVASSGFLEISASCSLVRTDRARVRWFGTSADAEKQMFVVQS